VHLQPRASGSRLGLTACQPLRHDPLARGWE